MNHKRVSDFVDQLQRQGRYAVDRAELEEFASSSTEAVSRGLIRLTRKHRIKRIRKRFYVILPVEYSAVGMIPPDWFIEDLMRYMQMPYYIGLQSAAALHGAAHQQVQQFQIVTQKQERPIILPGLSIRFFGKRDLSMTPLQRVKGHSGMLPVSTPEATALDLLRYSSRIGGVDAVLTILAELVESMRPEKLAAVAATEPELSQVQRLGWLLDHLGQTTLADALAQSLAVRRSVPRTKLNPSGVWGGASQNRWRVVENAQAKHLFHRSRDAAGA